MASNTGLNAGTGGDVIATKERTHDGDATKVQVVTLAGVTGTEGAYTFGDINGDATNGLDVDVTRVGGTVTVANAGTFAVQAAQSGTWTVDLGATDNAVLDAIAASLAGTLTVGSHAVTNAGTFAVQAASAGVAAENAAVSGNPVLVGGRYDSVARTLGNGDVGAAALNASGQLLVEIAAGAGSGGTAAADDADFTAGTTSGTPVMGVYESTPTSVTDGDLGTVGITASRELKVNVSSGGIAGVVDDAAVTPGTTEGVMFMAEFDDTTPDSVDEGDGGMLRMSANRNLYSTIRDAAGNERGVNVNTSNALLTTQTGALPAGTNNIGDVDVLSLPALPAGTNNIGDVDVLTVPADPFGANADAASATGSISAKLRFIASTGIPITGTVTVGSHAVTNAGTFATQVTSIAAGDNNIGNVDVVTLPSLPAGTNNIGDVDVATIAAGTNAIGNVGLVGRTTGGLTIFRSIDIDESEEEVKATAGQLFSIHAMNMTAAVLYLKFYNATAANVTVGTTTPVLTFPLATLGDTNGAGFVWNNDIGLAFGTAITVACTTGLADNDTGAPGANACVINLGYA